MNRIKSFASLGLLLLLSFCSIAQPTASSAPMPSVTNISPFRDVGNFIFTLNGNSYNLKRNAGPLKISCGKRGFIDRNSGIIFQPGVATRTLQLTGTAYYLCGQQKPNLSHVEYETYISTEETPGPTSSKSTTSIFPTPPYPPTTTGTTITEASSVLTPLGLGANNWHLAIAIDKSDYDFANNPNLTVLLTVSEVGTGTYIPYPIAFNLLGQMTTPLTLNADATYDVKLEINNITPADYTPNIKKKWGYKCRKMITYSHTFDLIVSAL